MDGAIIQKALPKPEKLQMWAFIVAAVIFFVGWAVHLIDSGLGTGTIGSGFVLFGLGFIAIGLAIHRSKP